MNHIAKNIRHLRLRKKISQEEMGMDLGISQPGLAAYEAGRNEPSIKMLIALADYFKIPIDVLLRADLSKSDEKGLLKIGNRLLLPIQVDDQGNDRTEVVTAKASAGYLNGFADPEYIEALPSMRLPFHVTGKNRAFPIKGDSMPPAETGDFVIGKYSESLKDIRDGDTYILVTRDEGIVYKRVYTKKGPGKTEYLELHSDNRQYEPYRVEASNVLEIWEHVCLLRMKDKKPDEINIENTIRFLQSMRVETVKNR